MLRMMMILAFLATVGCQSSVRVHGVRPIHPPLSVEIPLVDSLRPMLRWQSCGKHVGYDVIVARPIAWDQRLPASVHEGASEEARQAQIVYYREDLAKTSHTLQAALEPETTYVWSVRTRFGDPVRIGGWSTHTSHRPLTRRERIGNAMQATTWFLLGTAAAVATAPGGALHAPDELPRYARGEEIKLEYQPFTFRTPAANASSPVENAP